MSKDGSSENPNNISQFYSISDKNFRNVEDVQETQRNHEPDNQ